MVNETELAEEAVAKKLAGEIVLSDDVGGTIKKWRAIFKIPQKQLADHMRIMPSVVSDYENSRRKSPGVKLVRRIVAAMLAIDKLNGGKITKEFAGPLNKAVLSEAILDIKEFSRPVKLKDFCRKIKATPAACQNLFDGSLFGYTVVDSHKAITELAPDEMVKLYGFTNQRCLIFTKTSGGRSSMVALKVVNLRPALVVLHGTSVVDGLAQRIAESEGIPLAVCAASDVSVLLSILKKGFG